MEILAMATADTMDREQEYLEAALRGDEDLADEEISDDLTSLLEENARLRGLVVKLSDIILRHVNDRS
jgi:hypothetical protein